MSLTDVSTSSCYVLKSSKQQMTTKMDDKFSKSLQIQLNWLKVMELMEECIFHK